MERGIFGAILAAIAVIFCKRVMGKSPDYEAFLESVTTRDWYPVLRGACAVQNVPADIALSVVYQESRGDEGARGSSGEVGLMQLMPGAVSDYNRVTRSHVRDVSDPLNNITVGVWYLGYLKRHYDLSWSDALTAYNAGIGNLLSKRTRPGKYADDVLSRANTYGEGGYA